MILDTPRAYPIFLTKNYFSADAYNNGGTFSATSMAAFANRLYDMDPFAYGVSFGSSEGVAETIISQLFEGASIATRAVGMVALLNNNLKSFTLYGSTDGGTTWPLTLATVLNNAATNYILDLSAGPVSMNAFKCVATNTIGAVAEKQIGTIVLCGVLGQVKRAPNRIVRKYLDSQRVVVLADKSEDITYFKRSPASHEFYACDIEFTYLSDVDRDMLRTVRRTNPNFCLYPEPGERPGDLFYGRFAADWQDQQTELYKPEGNSTTISFKEISS